MAGYIDRQWVNKEIQNFNRGMHPYQVEDEERVQRLIDTIVRHLSIKDSGMKRDVQDHVRFSYDDEDKQMHTDAQEIMSSTGVDRGVRQTPDYARSSDALRAMDTKAAEGVVEKLLSETSREEI